MKGFFVASQCGSRLRTCVVAHLSRNDGTQCPDTVEGNAWVDGRVKAVTSALTNSQRTIVEALQTSDDPLAELDTSKPEIHQRQHACSSQKNAFVVSILLSTSSLEHLFAFNPHTLCCDSCRDPGDLLDCGLHRARRNSTLSFGGDGFQIGKDSKQQMDGERSSWQKPLSLMAGKSGNGSTVLGLKLGFLRSTDCQQAIPVSGFEKETSTSKK